ncbi:hypothetical protein [Acinetobacter sp. NS4_7]
MTKRTQQALIISGVTTFLFLLLWIVVIQCLVALATYHGAYQAIEYIQQAKAYFFVAIAIFYMTVFYFLFNRVLRKIK